LRKPKAAFSEAKLPFFAFGLRPMVDNLNNSSSSYRTPAKLPRAIRQRDLGGLDQSRFCDIAFLKALHRKEREKWRICGSRTRTKPKRGNVNG
jgi:hypothetical protein